MDGEHEKKGGEQITQNTSKRRASARSILWRTAIIKGLYYTRLQQNHCPYKISRKKRLWTLQNLLLSWVSQLSIFFIQHLNLICLTLLLSITIHFCLVFFCFCMKDGPRGVIWATTSWQLCSTGDQHKAREGRRVSWSTWAEQPGEDKQRRHALRLVKIQLNYCCYC